ncbi:amino acid/polyamine/organocation transporter, APC superfamily [Virgibacillus subterraneus]|uniref:Amino acid/polyamine/organocation transporter, APC superfamily n=1 Tax=Virgibacillus subterraneus TaxID=621109 RepID=A0A1H9ESN0_9BACI|nr:amino acid permease [Virgibacillus subterraneus]SEQ28746.1 amino acid/polyamine/organocation transporter, APC superfamily [Virgibacillus subterraneus]
MNNRSIGLFQGIALYIAAILGSGVLFLSGVTASIAGPASIVSWFIVNLISFPLAYSFARLARKYPDVGGAATFVRKSFGYHLGNIVGWFYFVTAAVGQTIVSLTGAFYVSKAFGFSPFVRTLIAVFILVIAGVSNYYGVNVSGKVALILSTLLLVLLLSAVSVSLSNIQWGNFTPFVPNGWFSVGSAMTVIFWSFFGWEAICNLANNFKKPDKDIVKGAVVSAVIIGVLFLALSLVTIGTATYGSKESNLSPIGVIMGDAVGAGAKFVTAILALIICTGTSNTFVASLTQLGYSLSRDGAFPKALSRLHTTTQIPRRMVLFVICFSAVGVLVVKALSLTFDDILFIPTSLGILVYILSMAAGVRLFKKSTLPWWASLTAFILCLLVIPFFQFYIFVPLIVVALYAIYMVMNKGIFAYKGGLKSNEGSK